MDHFYLKKIPTTILENVMLKLILLQKASDVAFVEGVNIQRNFSSLFNLPLLNTPATANTRAVMGMPVFKEI